MPHIPGHGISFADWFKNNPQQIGNRTIPNPMLDFGQIGSDIRGSLGSTDTVPLMLNSFPNMMPADVMLRPQFTNQSTDFFDRPQWIQANQPFVSPQPSIGVPPPRAHDAPFPLARPQPIDKIGQLDNASFLTAMGQMAGVQPGVNRQEGLADAMNRVRATTMVPPPNPSDLGVPPSVRDPLQWQQAGQPYAPPATSMVVPPPSAHDMGMPISAPIQSPAGRGSLPIEVLIASGGGLKRGLGNQMSSQLPPAYLSQMMQRRGMN